jgi:hypothetical protein
MIVKVKIYSFTCQAIGQICQDARHSRYPRFFRFPPRPLAPVIKIGPQARMFDENLISLYAHHRNLLVKLRLAYTIEVTELISDQVSLPCGGEQSRNSYKYSEYGKKLRAHTYPPRPGHLNL